MYQVFARKWRPQNFEQLVGQPHVARTLANAIESDRLAHAYIFAGLRGTGKTTVARILAKCLNCEQGPTTTPCGTCTPCTEIGGSRAIDVLEIDAASRTKVEQTRELLEIVTYAPVRDRYKIMIIDEAHMLSKASFNALLKTLEEPPPNVLFILATTELQKILPTILSRCQVFEFRRVSPAEVAAHLRQICDDEKIRVSDLALERLARSGEGSVRDSLSLLERAVAFCGTEIDDEDVLRMLGTVRGQVLAELVGGLARRDAAAMLGVLDGLVDEGHDLVHFWNATISALRDLLLMRTLDDCRELLSRPPDEADQLAAASDGLSREDLTRAFQILAELEPGLKASSQPRFLFEATLIRLASLGAVKPIEELLSGMASGAPPRAAAPQKKKPEPEPDRPAPVAEPVAATPPPPREAAPSPSTAAATGTAAEIVDAVHSERPMIGAMLDQASGMELVDGRLTIRFPRSMEACKKQIESRESLELLRTQAKRLTGGAVEIVAELVDEEPAAATRPPVESAPPPPTTPEPHEAPPPPEEKQPRHRPPGNADPLLEQARDEPGVQKLIDAFGAHIIEIRSHDEPARASQAKTPRPPEETA
jgi:DNA polymerase-3 subunit gamma/tau